MATTTPTAARDARGSEPLLPTYTDDADVEPMSERTPGHSKPAFGSGAHSNKIRDETTPAAPCASPPPSRRPAGVSSGLPIPPSLSHHRQPLPLAGNAGRRRHRLALVWSYAPDWVLCIGLSLCFSLLDYIHGFWREFALTDTSIQHTFTVHERVPDWMLGLLAGLAPMALLSLINFCSIQSWWDLHIGWLGLLLSLTLTGVVAQAMKITVGRPRPDLIARCLPKPGSENGPVFGLVTAEICTQTDIFILKDGFRSFPSGHASLSFAGLGFLSFYLAGKIHLFDARGYTSKALVALTPLIGAALIAVSRTMDYRHHWQDVTAGSFLGLGLAFFAYRQYYPPLSSAMSHRPYKPRILRRKEQYAAANADPEGSLHVHHLNRSAMATEEDLPGHGPSASMYNAATYPPQSNQVRRVEAAEMNESNDARSVPDEERGISKPVLPTSIQEIWKEERERGEGL